MRTPLKALSVFTAIAIPLLAGGAVAPPVMAAGAQTLYVSVQGNDANACTQAAPCATIGHAVSVAGAGDTVVVGHGIYHEDVTITTALTLTGQGGPIVNASQLTNGIVISGTAAAGTVVRGFTVENALFEGILAVQTQGVTIQNNVVTDNDQGMFLPPAQQTGECQGFGQVPGDCGEGLHLMSVIAAKVLNNTVSDNSGGILLSDENGITAYNLIAGNKVLNNVYDCGITVVAHTPLAFGGGVHDNTVLGNVVNGNGVQGEGGGILLAAGAPGGGVYDNRILFNVANDNGLAGVTIHKHDPFSNLNGNVIVGNHLSHDALDGNGPGMPGDGDTSDTQTTGLLIAAASTPITGTVVAGNHISDVYYGIWTQNASPISPSANTFVNVTVPVFQQ
jgi:hypothetical protein